MAYYVSFVDIKRNSFGRKVKIEVQLNFNKFYFSVNYMNNSV